MNHNEIRLIFLFKCLFFTQTEIDRYISIDRLIEIRIDNKDNRIRQSNQTSCWSLWDKLFELDYLGQKKVSNQIISIAFYIPSRSTLTEKSFRFKEIIVMCTEKRQWIFSRNIVNFSVSEWNYYIVTHKKKVLFY